MQSTDIYFKERRAHATLPTEVKCDADLKQVGRKNRVFKPSSFDSSSELTNLAEQQSDEVEASVQIVRQGVQFTEIYFQKRGVDTTLPII